MSSAQCVIHLESLAHNFRQLQKAADGRAIFAVIKANAYGLGANEIAKFLERQFSPVLLPLFCLARYSELEELRASGVTRPVLIMSEYHHSKLYQNLSSEDHLCFCDEQDLEIFASSASSKSIKAHLDFNTGMNRLGLSPDLVSSSKIDGFIGLLERCVSRGLVISGIMTHLACAESDPDVFSKQQLSKISSIVKDLKRHWKKSLGDFPKWIHVENSEGVAHGVHDSLVTAIRPGLHLWGIQETLKTQRCKYPLMPAVSVRGRVRQIHNLNVGDGVGYGLNYRCAGSSKIATINLGYADGVPRLSSEKKLGLIVNGTHAPFVGRISMDLCAIDVSNMSQVKVGDWAYWICAEQTLEFLASQLGTISYEMQSILGRRLERVLKEGGMHG